MIDENKNRIECLDSLRGLAALTVVFSHFNNDYLGLSQHAKQINYSPLHLFYDGEAAVAFFFVLSGFVLSWKYISGEGRPAKKLLLGPYLIGRFFRIYPLFWAVLILSAVAAATFNIRLHTIPDKDWSIWWWNDSFDLKLFLKQSALLFQNSIAGRLYIPQSWSLAVEIILSALVPFFILMVIRNTLWLILFIIIMLGIFDMYIFIIHFSLGILLVKYFDSIQHFMHNKSARFKLLLILAGLFFYSYRYSVAAFFPTLSILQWILFSEISVNTIIGLGVIMILVGVLNSNRVKKILMIPVLKLLGKTSYGLYLSHMIVMIVFTPHLLSWLNSLGFYAKYPLLLIALSSTVIVAVFLAWILRHLVELRGIQFGRKVSSAYQTLFFKKSNS